MSERAAPPAAERTELDLLWRAWRNCDDPEHAGRLFSLAAERPLPRSVRHRISLFVDLTWAATGAVVGFAVAGLGLSFFEASASQGAGVGALAGLFAGLLSTLDLQVSAVAERWLRRVPKLLLPPLVVFSLQLLLVPFFSLAAIAPDETLAGAAGVGSRVALLSAAFLVGAMARNVKPDAWEPFTNRPLFVWWRRRPPVAGLARLLRRLASEHAWAEVLVSRLEGDVDPSRYDEYLQALRKFKRWPDQLRGMRGLVGIGGEVAERLLPFARGSGDDRDEVRWVLESIATESQERYPEPGRWLCPRCYARATAHDLPGVGPDLHGCRRCHRTRDLDPAPPGGVVCVLDRDWKDVTAREGGELRINWFAMGEPFDLDRVRILRASDADVESLAISFANDQDPDRPRRWDRVTVDLAPGLVLGDNARAVLAKTFGKVRVHEATANGGGGAPDRS